jgi:hypothetical protein
MMKRIGQPVKVHLGDYRKNRAVNVRIDSWDTYSLDHTLALIILPALERFKKDRKKCPGVPSTMFLDTDPVDKHGNHTDAAIKIAEKRWIEAIDKMIWSFKELLFEKEYKKCFKKNGKKWKTVKRENGNSELVETGFDFDKSRYQEVMLRRQEGLELFGKYFDTLWW